MDIKTITVTTGIEDTRLRTATPDNNHGGAQTLAQGSGIPLLYRVPTAQIPLGIIVAWRFVYYTAATVSVNKLFRLKDAANWVVGTADGAPQEGSCCWNGIEYHAAGTTPWLGGGAFSNADYDSTDAAIEQIANASAGKVAMPVVWATDWRDGVRTNNGFCSIFVSGGSSYGAINNTTVAYRPYFEFDMYNTAQGGSLHSATPIGFNTNDDDEQELAIVNLTRLRPYGWLMTGLEVIKPFGLKDEFRELFTQYHDVDKMTNQASVKQALRFLQLEYDLDLLEVMAVIRREGLV